MSYGISYYAKWNLGGFIDEYKWFDSYSELTAWEKAMLEKHGDRFHITKTGTSAEANDLIRSLFC